MTRESDHAIRIQTSSQQLNLTRRFSIDGHRVIITDTIANPTNSDLGVLVRNHVVTPTVPAKVFLAGVPEVAMRLCAENPTALIEMQRSSLGLLAEDSASRLQLELSSYQNEVAMELNHIGVPANNERTLRWTLYPLQQNTDYFSFINQVRRDWNTNFTINGPWEMIDVVRQRDLLANPGRLRDYLKREKIGIAALMPWLDYDNFNELTNHAMDRDEYKALMKHAAQALREANPRIKIVGCMEGNIVSLPPQAVKPMFEAIPVDHREHGDMSPFNDRQMELVKQLPLRWKDCLLQDPNGRYRYELYYRGRERTPLVAVLTYAARDNDMQKYWLDEAQFLMDEVGLDGIYVDQFNMAFSDTQRYSYERWDGLTVEIDPQTGQIARRYTDGAYVGIDARQALIKYVLSRGGTMVTNTNCAAEELQKLPIARFMEAEWAFNFPSMQPGQKPPLQVIPSKGQLGSPVALGSRPGQFRPEDQSDYARYIMKTVMAYLRHGLLYYHYQTEIPESGPGSGEYGPINHMFPFTPQELHEGWIVGKERIVGCVSFDMQWTKQSEPKVVCFDIDGREIKPEQRVTIESLKPDLWRIRANIKDWAEFVVIE